MLPTDVSIIWVVGIFQTIFNTVFPILGLLFWVYNGTVLQRKLWTLRTIPYARLGKSYTTSKVFIESGTSIFKITKRHHSLQCESFCGACIFRNQNVEFC